jgi:hypothetical protein
MEEETSEGDFCRAWHDSTVSAETGEWGERGGRRTAATHRRNFGGRRSLFGRG